MEDPTLYSTTDFDPNLNSLIDGFLDVDDIMKRHWRSRRNTMKKDSIEHVTKIMESIEEELDDLKVTFWEILVILISRLGTMIMQLFIYNCDVFVMTLFNYENICNNEINQEIADDFHSRFLRRSDQSPRKPTHQSVQYFRKVTWIAPTRYIKIRRSGEYPGRKSSSKLETWECNSIPWR